MSFEMKTQARFAQVDPAGFVFFPRYFEMLSAAVEDWFASMGWDYRSLQRDRQMGVPLVKLEAQFHSPSLLGDQLTVRLEAPRVGNSSCEIKYAISCGDDLKMEGSALMVCIDTSLQKSMPWPNELRAKMQRTD